MKPPSFKQKQCAHCGHWFIPLRALQNVCGPICARRLVEAKKAKAKRELRERKEKMKTCRELRAEAQDIFNNFIRLRDSDLPCVSCGVQNPPMLPGGQWDAGHFLSRGAYPELAFNEDNVHKQCKSCNAGSGKFSHKARTVAERFEAELLRRIGPERLAALKGPHEPQRLREADYVELKETYRQKLKKLKELKKGYL